MAEESFVLSRVGYEALQRELAGFATLSLPRHLDLITRGRPFEHHLGAASFHAERNIIAGNLAVGKRLLALGTGGSTRQFVALYFEHERRRSGFAPTRHTPGPFARYIGTGRHA